MSSAIGSLASAAGGNGPLLKYSFGAALASAASWQIYQGWQTKAITGKSWQDIARDKKRNAAAAFCSYVSGFHSSLRVARNYLQTGRIEEAMVILVRLLEIWQFRAHTLKALKRHLHPEFFARLINILVERRMFDCRDVLSHLSSGVPARPSHHVGLNMDLHLHEPGR